MVSNAITFEIKRIERRVEKAVTEKTPFIKGDRIPRNKKTTSEAAQALRIALLWRPTEVMEGRSNPNANFVVAVEPTMELTSPATSIMAG